MAVGRVRGGKGPQAPGGAGGSDKSGSAGGTTATSGTYGSRATAGAQGPAGAQGAQASSEVVGSAGPKAVDPLSTRALMLAQELRAGKITKDEARKQLIADTAAYVTKKKLRIDSKKLEDKVRTAAGEDPNLAQLVDRILSKG